MTDMSIDELSHDMVSDSNSLGAVSDIGSGVGGDGCPYAKRMRLNDSYESNYAEDVTASFRHDPSEVDKLKVFQVLDEVEGDNDDDEGDGGDNADDEFDYSDIDLDEVEQMLDENLPDEFKNRKKDQEYEERAKIVLEEKGRNHFEVLPEGWLQATHNSGIPVYLNKHTRVCTLSKPYFLGPGSVRKHEIPLSAIPCLNYRKALAEEERMKEEMKKAKETAPVLDAVPTTNTNGPILLNNVASNATATTTPAEPKAAGLPSARIETVTENEEAKSLTSDQVREYCEKLFKFRTIRVLRFKSWASRRKFTRNRKNIKHLKRPTLPDGTKLITFPVINTEDSENKNARPKKDWIMNPNGKSYVCILHEYVQHALKKQPTYEFKELNNAASPYSAIVTINDIKYGTGFGTSKKQAKSEAARETLEILIPDMKDKITGNKETPKKEVEQYDLSVFDEIAIEDPRVAEFCAKTTEPSPHTILLTCLQRNFGMSDVQIKYDINMLKHKKNEFTMTVGKHTATVVCRNKRDGKQRASQAILQILHPHIKNWGSLLRLYGNKSVKSFKEKKQEEQEITVLQSKAAVNQPNYAILEKLQEEMLKLEERRRAIIPIGTFRPDTELPKASGSNLKNVDL